MSQFNLRTCSGCGKTFLAKRADARFCNEKSTCRVKASRAKKKAQIEAERLTLDVDTYELYQRAISEKPELDKMFRIVLERYGKSAMFDAMFFSIITV